jgi:acyl-coenzyme A thioesterase 13
MSAAAARRVATLARHAQAAHHPLAAAPAAAAARMGAAPLSTSSSSPASSSSGSGSGTTDGAGGATTHHHHASPPAAKSNSFIDRVKAYGASAMLGTFVNTGTRFDRVLEGMSVTAIGPGSVTCELDVRDGLQNSYSTLHGGAICTLVDVVGTMALLTVDPLRAGVSVDLSVSFVASAKAGERVRLEGRVLKAGKRLGFTQVREGRGKEGGAWRRGPGVGRAWLEAVCRRAEPVGGAVVVCLADSSAPIDICPHSLTRTPLPAHGDRRTAGFPVPRLLPAGCRS